MPQKIFYGQSSYWTYDNELIIRKNYSASTKIINFNIEANTFKFKIKEISADYEIIIKVDDRTSNIITQQNIYSGEEFSIQETTIPHDYYVTLQIKCNDEDVVLTDLVYRNYSLIISEIKNELICENGLYKIQKISPNNPNELIISLSSKQGNAPIINKICFSKKPKLKYTSRPFKNLNNFKRIINLKTNAKVYLTRENSNGEQTIEEYDFNSFFKATSDNSYLKFPVLSILKSPASSANTGIADRMNNNTVRIENIKSFFFMTGSSSFLRLYSVIVIKL
jgi:hypothetical protein